MENKIKIPKNIKLMGQTINIKWEKDLVQIHDAYGHARYRDNEIVLQISTESTKIPETVIEETYFHELVHFIAYMLGESELRDNEKLIYQISGLLHQAFRTANYGK